MKNLPSCSKVVEACAASVKRLVFPVCSSEYLLVACYKLAQCLGSLCLLTFPPTHIGLYLYFH